ncbi:hypothetical protein V6N13_127178 [Hibiscus sabdariffa]|uniref:MLO-like protein n=1 Tax=Hibiscus sabdariffa TaxID=183260 RepID=A0ABR2RDE3_9ROSI
MLMRSELWFCLFVMSDAYEAGYLQMGSGMKKSVFDEQTTKALKKWRLAAKKKHGKAGKSPTRITLGGSGSSASPAPASGRSLHRSKTTGHSSYAYEDRMSDVEAEPLSPMSPSNLIISVDCGEQTTETQHIEAGNEDDFSFVKSAPLKQGP